MACGPNLSNFPVLIHKVLLLGSDSQAWKATISSLWMYQACILFRGPGNFLGLAGLGYRFPKVTESTDLTDFYLKDSPFTLSASTYRTLEHLTSLPSSRIIPPRNSIFWKPNLGQQTALGNFSLSKKLPLPVVQTFSKAGNKRPVNLLRTRKGNPKHKQMPVILSNSSTRAKAKYNISISFPAVLTITCKTELF